MSQVPSSLDVDALLAGTEWVRALARTLLRDRHAAEDIMQETQHRALTAAERAVRIKEWLGLLVANLATSFSSRSGDRSRDASTSTAHRPHPTRRLRGT